MSVVFLGWTDFKQRVLDKDRLIWTNRDDKFYWIAYQDFYTTVVIEDPATADQTDFETNYKDLGNKSLPSPKNPDGRTIIHTTPRKRGLFTCFTSRGDDPASNVAISGGNFLEMNHQIGDQPTQSIYVHFNTIANETFAHAGSIQWKDALLDAFSLETVPSLSTYEAGTNTNFNLYGGYLIIPAAGNGTINVTDMVLVEVPINEFDNRSGAGYWNATFNTGTGEFENIAAAPLGDGQFNMFVAEVVLDRFVNKMLLLGSGFMPLDTYDSSMIGHNMKLKITLETRGDDHAWMWCGNLKPYRKRTV